MTQLPPNNIDAEQSILGCMLLDSNAVPVALSRLNREDFYKNANGIIYSAISELNSRESDIDLLTITDFLETNGLLQAVGGPVYIASLTSVLPSMSGLRSYIGIVRRKAQARRLMAAAANLQHDCTVIDDPEELMDRFSGNIMDVMSGANESSQPLSFYKLISDSVARTRANAESSEVSGIMTGFSDLDNILFGLQPTDMIVIAGRPGMGKTTFSLNLVRAASLAQKRVLYFSLEMSNQQLGMKILSDMSGVGLSDMQRGIMTEIQWERLKSAEDQARAVNDMAEFVDEPALTITRLRNKAKMHAMGQRVDIIVVDYLQLMRDPKASSDEQEIRRLSGGIKALAKEMKVPVVVLSQLSRKCEDRTDKRPLLSDLRYSGAIEQDADVIMFLYRDDYYHQESPDAGLIEVNVAKHRNGATGRALLGFDPQISRFYDLTQRAEN